jgi:hypothetical protein
MMKVPLQGGTPTVLANGRYPTSIVVSADWVYWLDCPVVLR